MHHGSGDLTLALIFLFLCACNGCGKYFSSGGNETIVVALSGDDGAGKTAMACSLACQAAEMLQISPQRRIYVNMLDISRPNNDLQVHGAE